MPDPEKPVPGKDLPEPFPDGPKPVDEPEPDGLPDEVPRPNPDETREPPLQTMATPPRPVPPDPQPPMPPGPRPEPGPDPSPIPQAIGANYFSRRLGMTKEESGAVDQTERGELISNFRQVHVQTRFA